MNGEWGTSTLAQVSDFQGGSQPPKSKFVDKPCEGYVRLLQIRDFKSDHRAVYIPISKKNRTCNSDDIMIGRYGASVGQIHRGKEGAYNVALIKTIPNPKLILKDFFYHYLNSDLFQVPLSAVAERSAQAGFSKSDIAPFEVPLPPLSEQKRIVAILDEAFAAIDTAVANTEKNLVNARELFESYLNKVFTQGGDGWVETALAELARFIDYRGKTPKKTESGIRLITAKNVRMGYLRKEPEEFVSADDYDGWMTRGIPLVGDVLFTTEAPLGLVCQLDIDEKVVFAQRIITLQTDRDVINPAFLKFALMSSLLQSRLLSNATGATAQGIKASLLKRITIPVPDIETQKLVIASCADISESVGRLTEVYNQKILDLLELKKAILQRAFSGALTHGVEITEEKAIA